MADCKKYNGSTWQHSLRKLTTATDTIATLPAVLYPTGTTATVGLKGNAQQNSTPTPDNPIMPQGCGNMTGNLFDVSRVIYGTWTDNSGRTQPYAYGARSIDIPSNQITVSFNGSVFPFSYSIVFLNSNDEFIIRYHKSTSSQIREPQTFTPPNTATKFYIQLANGTDSSYPITKELIESYKLMLNLGSTPLPYEPYGYKLDISSGNTTTPVYLGEVQSTRRIGKQILTGTELVLFNGNSTSNRIMVVTVPTAKTGTNTPSNVICTHFETKNTVSQTAYGGITMRSNGIDFVIGIGYDIINVDRDSTAVEVQNAFKSYLATQYANGTPVTVWYVLATPTTDIVNEPLRKIGDYADTVSGISIPTITGKDTFDAEATLKPSEVSLSYTGWHDASVKEWDGSEWQ